MLGEFVKMIKYSVYRYKIQKVDANIIKTNFMIE